MACGPGKRPGGPVLGGPSALRERGNEIIVSGGIDPALHVGRRIDNFVPYHSSV
jgi:hypothetical protein